MSASMARSTAAVRVRSRTPSAPKPQRMLKVAKRSGAAGPGGGWTGGAALSGAPAPATGCEHPAAIQETAKPAATRNKVMTGCRAGRRGPSTPIGARMPFPHGSTVAKALVRCFDRARDCASRESQATGREPVLAGVVGLPAVAGGHGQEPIPDVQAAGFDGGEIHVGDVAGLHGPVHRLGLFEGADGRLHKLLKKGPGLGQVPGRGPAGAGFQARIHVDDLGAGRDVLVGRLAGEDGHAGGRDEDMLHFPGTEGAVESLY